MIFWINLGGKLMKTQKKSKIEDICPLSPMQEGMLYISLLGNNATTHFIQMSFNIAYNMNIELLEKSINEIIKRHSILRTVFNYTKTKKPVQIVLRERPIAVHYEDLREKNNIEQEEYIQCFKEEERQKGFDLTKDKLIKLSVFRLDDNKDKLLFSFHHILMDGWCMGIIIQELFDTYYALEDRKTVIAPMEYPYSNYIKWLQSKDKEAALGYWQGYLDGFEEKSSIPTKNNGLDIDESLEKQTFDFKLDRQVTKQLVQMAKDHDVTLNTIFQAIWGVLLRQYSNSNDIVFGAVVSGRPQDLIGADTMVGLFINTIPVRMKFQDECSFETLIKETQRNAIESEQYHFCSLAEIQNISNQQELFDHIMIFENYPLEKNLNDNRFKYAIDCVEAFDQNSYKFNVTVFPDDELLVRITYDEQLYEESFVKALQNHLQNIIHQVVQQPTILLKDISIVTESEQCILEQFNDTFAPYRSDKTISEIFEENVSACPDKVAVVFGEHALTYQELYDKSEKIAYILREKGVSNNSIVGILASRSLEMFVGIMGILKAGGAYLPLDPEYPPDRIKFMLEDSEANILLTHREMAGLLENIDSKVESIYLEKETFDAVEAQHLECINVPSDLAYVIYTSGSTGVPKGVMIEQRNVINFAKGITERIDICSSKAVLCLTTISFDIFVLESLLPLMYGIKVILSNENEQKDAEALNAIIVKNEVETIQITPSRLKMMMDSGKLNCLNNLKHILIGGEAFPVQLQEALCKVYTGKIYNMYGPTETTVWSSIDQIEKDVPITIGQPIINTKMYILDQYQRLQPIGIPGELYIGGEGVTRGYFKRETLTKERFIENPVKGDGCKRIYKTGDLARWLPNGKIEFLGRMDEQVKVRGYRIEIGEIETLLLKCTDIKEAVVVVKEDKQKIKYICAYFVSEHEIDTQSLRNDLASKLPYYMVPSFFIAIDKIPVTPNGKINRKALPNPLETESLNTNYVKPRNLLEEQLASIWAEVLGVKSVGIYDNYYSLGGHSIYMMQIIGKINSILHVDVSISEFISHDNITLLAELISEKENIETKQNTYIHQEPDVANQYEQFPITDVQLAYLLGRNSQFEMGGIATHIYMEAETNKDVERFNAAINKVIARHPMLRTIIYPTGKQQILKEVPQYKIIQEDLRGMSQEQQEALILEQRERMSHHVFKSDEWPLFEIKSYQLDEEKSYLFIGIDMLIADASSMLIIQNEVQQYYDNLDVKLPKLQFTFRDYMLAYEKLKASKQYAEDKAYWMAKKDNFPMAPAVPLKVDPSTIEKPQFNRISERISKEDWNKLKNIAYDKAITPSVLLCTAYAKILSLWSNQKEVAINLTVFNRYPFNEQVGQIVGDFTSVILVDVDCGMHEAFWQVAKRVKETLVNALEHRHYDGVEFIRELAKDRGNSNKVAMPIVFTSMLMDNNQSNPYEKVTYSLTQTSQVYLDYQAKEENGELVLAWDYVKQLFDENVIKSMFEQYLHLILDLLEADSKNTQKEQSLLNEMITKYNDTAEYIPQKTLHGLFMEQAKKNPYKEAVVFKNESISYAELNSRSNKVANYLRSIHVKEKDFVAVIGERCISTMVNILGILKAGAAYVPIGPTYPNERKNYIMSHSNCKCLLDADSFETYGMEALSDVCKEIRYNPEDVAYIIYTSGSTGKPKGVVISHDGACNTIIDINTKFEVSTEDRIIGLSSMCFDLSVYDIFGAFAAGATLVIVEDQRDVMELYQLVNEQKITIWNSVPAIMEMLVNNMDKPLKESALRLVMMSGDWIPLNLPVKIQEKFNNPQIISLGGATEASIWSIYYPVQRIDETWKSIPYGMPLANQTFYVLNYEMEVCPIGVEGELYIGGRGVALEYANEIEKTKYAFIEHPQFGKLYRTGDYGAWIQDDQTKELYIEFRGRKDQQVKIRGYRIELEEIENCLISHDFISQAIVMQQTNAQGINALVAYYITDEELTDEELKIYLNRYLPEYMVPSYFVELEEMPLTDNGKINKKALPKINVEVGNKYVAPTNEIERKICKIWEKILHIESVGITDNYFDLGGNSLMLATLITELNNAFNMTIPLKEIFAMSTVQGIAHYISENKEESIDIDDSILALLKREIKSDKNLFLIHAGSGEIEGYIELCNLVDMNFNCWAIRSERFNNYEPKNISIEELAEQYIEKIKKVQPVGPYYIAGWCVGGTIAFEMVRQLEMAGEKVEVLTLINSYAPGKEIYGEVKPFTLETEKMWIQDQLIDDSIIDSQIIKLDEIKDISKIWLQVVEVVSKVDHLDEVLQAIKEKIPPRIANIVPNFDDIDLKGLMYYLNVIRTYSNARAFYVPQNTITTPVFFIEANDTPISNKDTWQNYCEPEVTFETVDGNHFSIFKTPYVNELAEHITRIYTKCIRK